MDDSDSSLDSQLVLESSRVADAAAGSGAKIVLAESCTAGLIAASLTKVAGASTWFCGSSVVYQEPTKIAWLNVSSGLIRKHSAESAEVTEAMSRAILEVTPHANLSLATTGHLEPDASRERRAPYVFVCISQRNRGKIVSVPPVESPLSGNSRGARQQSATLSAVQGLLKFLNR